MPFLGYDIGDYEIGDDVESLLGDYEVGGYEVGDWEVGDWEIGADTLAQRAASLAPARMNMPVPTRRAMPAMRLPGRTSLQAPTLVHEIEPTKARQFPLGIDSVATIAAAATSNLTTRPQDVFRVERLVVPSAIASSFVINDIKVGKNSQLVNSVALPAQAFTEGAFGVRLRCDTAQVGADISVNVTNISAGALRFIAAIIGVALE